MNVSVLTGDVENEELAELRDQLDGFRILSVEQLSVAAFDSVSIKVVVVYSPRPEIVTQQQVDIIRKCAPNARVLFLLGPWHAGKKYQPFQCDNCEFLKLEHARTILRKIEAIQASNSNRNTTASTNGSEKVESADREIKIASDFARQPFEHLSLKVGIIAESWDTFDAIASVCSEFVKDVIWIHSSEQIRSEKVECLFFASNLAGNAYFESLESWCSRAEFIPTVAILGFPRDSDFHRVQNAGASDLIPKPFELVELYDSLRQVCAQNHAS